MVLNLNGFRIFGSEGPVYGIGVYVLGRSGVKVLNGTVSDFEIGVAIEGGHGNTVQRIVAENNYGQSGTSRGGDGIAILSSSGNRINRKTSPGTTDRSPESVSIHASMTIIPARPRARRPITSSNATR